MRRNTHDALRMARFLGSIHTVNNANREHSSRLHGVDLAGLRAGCMRRYWCSDDGVKLKTNCGKRLIPKPTKDCVTVTSYSGLSLHAAFAAAPEWRGVSSRWLPRVGGARVVRRAAALCVSAPAKPDIRCRGPTKAPRRAAREGTKWGFPRVALSRAAFNLVGWLRVHCPTLDGVTGLRRLGQLQSARCRCDNTHTPSTMDKAQEAAAAAAGMAQMDYPASELGSIGRDLLPPPVSLGRQGPFC
ncbi:hypothetical protein HPB51_025403 [Rhipicephalus microplus]|uniref:Uncharacterized protein n=1 Tax=Rhipicephalus microplus TaxID=6941 RepID=A0A9J6DE09_RHIMP|nr:hypothetical protein HPB51_025403 [Rhipicephalus microplus]